MTLNDTSSLGARDTGFKMQRVKDKWENSIRPGNRGLDRLDRLARLGRFSFDGSSRGSDA